MIYNLCDNAIKYSRPGGHAELQMTSEPGKGSEFKVLFPKADPSAPQS